MNSWLLVYVPSCWGTGSVVLFDAKNNGAKGFATSEVPLFTSALTSWDLALGITLAGRENEAGSSEAPDLAGSNGPVLSKHLTF